MVAAAGPGRAAVAWEISQSPTNQLQQEQWASLPAELLVASGGSRGFAAPVTLATAPESELSGPWGLYFDSAGNATVAWAQCASQRCEVRVATVRRSREVVPPGAFGVQWRPAQFDFDLATRGPVLAGDRRGDLVLAWSDQNGVYAAIRKAGQTHFGRATQLSPRVTPEALNRDSISRPLAAFGPNGGAIVTWCQDRWWGPTKNEWGPTEMAAVYQP
jgi:hypothetical protein